MILGRQDLHSGLSHKELKTQNRPCNSTIMYKCVKEQNLKFLVTAVSILLAQWHNTSSIHINITLHL